MPKRIGLNNPEAIASWVARPMILLSKIGGPVVHGLTAATNLVLRVFGIKGEAEPNLTEDEIKALISQGAETGAVGATEENIVQRVFQLGDQRVAAIMTPLRYTLYPARPDPPVSVEGRNGSNHSSGACHQVAGPGQMRR